jgi:hypothetical protein
LTLVAGVALGAKGKELLAAASPRVGRIVRPALRATIRQSLVVSREVQRIAESAREDLEDVTAEARREAAAQQAPGSAEQPKTDGSR